MAINSREQLIHVLTEAAEIEHNLLCSYLYAVFSMKREGEAGLSSSQGKAVERWRKMILTIALEEMGHLACVNNLLLAVGGAPHFDRPNFPVAPGYHPASVIVRLTPFDAATLDHFIYLERPQGMDLRDGEGFEGASDRRVTPIEGLTPSAQDYPTVGELYDQISDGFRQLVVKLGEDCLFDTRGTAQLSSDVIGLPDIIKVTDLASALATVEHIKEEGEGSTCQDVNSHFDRFQAIKQEWADMLHTNPDFAPAWPAAHDPVMRKPADDAARVWITEPSAAAHLDLANAIYGTMLSLLSQAFGSFKEKEKRMLMSASVEVMEASAAISSALARMPATPDGTGVNAGMTFAVPRNAGYRPTAGFSRQFLERLLELQSGAETVLTGELKTKALRRLGNAIALLEGRA